MNHLTFDTDRDLPSLGFTHSSERLANGPHRLGLVAALALGALGSLFLALGDRNDASALASGELLPLELGCERGDAVSCNDLGVSYQRGYSVEADSTRAFRLFQRACEQGSAEGCSNLGALHEHGAGTAPSLAEAVRLYQQACQAGSALGCSNLGALHAAGKGVAKDAEEARRLFSLACEGGSATGCQNLMASSL